MEITENGYQDSRESLTIFTIKNYKKFNTIHYDEPNIFFTKIRSSIAVQLINNI